MSGMFGGSTPTPPIQTFNFPGMAEAAGGALGGIGGLSSFAQPGALGQIGGITQGLVGSPLSGAGMSEATALAPSGVGIGTGAAGLGSALIGSGNPILSTIGPLLMQAFDPQGSLYQRTANQVSDQTLSNLANAGVQGTPWGQSVLGNTMGNFNIDWQNNLLSRMLQGIQGAGSAVQGAGAAGSQGLGLGAGGIGQAIQSSLLPYSVQSQIGGNQLGWLNQLIGSGSAAAQIPQQQIADFLNYLSGGTASMNANNQAALNQAQFAAGQEQQRFSNIGSSIGGLGSLLGSGGPFGGGILGGGAFGSGGAFSGLGSAIGSGISGLGSSIGSGLGSLGMLAAK